MIERTHGGYPLEEVAGAVRNKVFLADEAVDSLIAHIRELQADLARVTAELKLERDTLAHINAEAEVGDKECCYQNRLLQARVATLTAERDARVVLPEIPEGHELSVVVIHGESLAAMTRQGEFDSKTLYATSGPTPAAALEALRAKMEASK